MLHGLRKELAKSFGYSLHDSDSHDVRAFLEYEERLFFARDPSQPTYLEKTEESGGLYNVVNLQGATNVQLPRPFIFSLVPTEANMDAARLGDGIRRNIVLYDNAGESFDLLKDRDGRNRVTQHLSECDAVVFALDPLQDPDARTRLTAISRDPQLGAAAVTNRQTTILSETIHRLRRYRGVPENKRLDCALVVCVLKYDVWKSLVPYAVIKDGDGDERCVIDQSSVQYFPSLGIAGLDVEEIDMISVLIRSFVEDLSPEFVALAEASFKTVRYFPVSALGTSPEATGKFLTVRPMDIQPFRVTHPMLWLLRHWKLIRRTKPRSAGVQRYRPARIESVIGGRMRVLSPVTNQVILLDAEYAGASIVDPTSGEMIGIPALESLSLDDAGQRTPPCPATSRPPIPPPVPSAVKLKLDEPRKPAKRGWFGKK